MLSLLKHGAFVDSREDALETPLYVAAREGNDEIVKVCRELTLGNKDNVSLHVVDSDGSWC